MQKKLEPIYISSQDRLMQLKDSVDVPAYRSKYLNPSGNHQNEIK